MIYDKGTSRQAMRRSFLWVSSSILIILAITVISNLFWPTAVFEEVSTNLLNYDLMPTYNWEADSAAEVGLRVEIPEQSTTLSYSSQAEVFRFTLDSDGPFTLRYLTLQVHSEGLQPFETWAVYPIVDGQVDFTQPVGNGEKWDGDLLRLRFYSSAASAYTVDPGEHTFVLVTSVLKDPTGEAPEMVLSFPRELVKEWNWAWLPGQHQEVWLDVSEALGVEAVEELPVDSIEII